MSGAFDPPTQVTIKCDNGTFQQVVIPDPGDVPAPLPNLHYLLNYTLL